MRIRMEANSMDGRTGGPARPAMTCRASAPRLVSTTSITLAFLLMVPTGTWPAIAAILRANFAMAENRPSIAPRRASVKRVTVEGR